MVFDGCICICTVLVIFGCSINVCTGSMILLLWLLIVMLVCVGGNGHVWLQHGDDIDGEAAKDQSGAAVALSGDGSTIAVGAPFNDNAVTGQDAGHVRVFRDDGTTWVQLGDDIDGQAADDQSVIAPACFADRMCSFVATNRARRCHCHVMARFWQLVRRITTAMEVTLETCTSINSTAMAGFNTAMLSSAKNPAIDR
jgi:hypothetical protein